MGSQETSATVGPSSAAYRGHGGSRAFLAGYATDGTYGQTARHSQAGNREARELRNAAYYQLRTDSLRKQEYTDPVRHGRAGTQRFL